MPNRRRFLKTVPAGAALGGLSNVSAKTTLKRDFFKELGVRPFLNFAQDSFVVRLERHPDRAATVTLGAEFYPPALPPEPEPLPIEEEDDGPQPYVEGQPTMMDPNPPPPKPAPVRKRAPRKSADGSKPARKTVRRKKGD